eukprot:scaffold492385_cov17-Prasinocladus_malaysianus.AAC.1
MLWAFLAIIYGASDNATIMAQPSRQRALSPTCPITLPGLSQQESQPISQSDIVHHSCAYPALQCKA